MCPSAPSRIGCPGPPPRRGKRTVLVLAALALLVLVALVGSRPRRLWLTWRQWQAREACLASDFDFLHPGTGWASLLGSVPESYPQLAALLRDPDPRVWWKSAPTIDGVPRADLLSWLRSNDPAAALAYLLEGPYCDATLWRGVSGADGELDPLGYGYWSGRNGHPLEPFEAGVRFLEGIVDGAAHGRLEVVRTSLGVSDLKKRAVGALAAMLRPGDTDRPGSEAARRVRSAMERLARSDPDPEVRFEAIRSLVQRSTAWRRIDDPGGSWPPSLDEWERLASAVRAWWDAHGEAIGWNAERRRFLAPR